MVFGAEPKSANASKIAFWVKEIMSQREGKHDKTDKIRQKRMPKKKRTSCSLEISSKNFTINA